MRGAIDTVLFDLDGTLLDTAGDMGAALNAVLSDHGRAPLAPQTIRPHVSRGGMALVRLGFGIDPGHRRADSLYQQLLGFYAQNLSANTRLFPGMEALLAHLEASGRRYGVVTNKPAFLTDPLLREMQLTGRMACVVSGDTLAKKKPWPDQLLHACEVLDTSAARSVYIGDDRRDIESGRRAGMRTIAAAYGYIAPGEDPGSWGADAIVGHAGEIKRWLDDRDGAAG